MRVLKEIKKPNREHTRRLLQCLVVAIRPLQVSELAEILAFDFDEEAIPKLNPTWRWEDQELALLSSCSSLISIVESHGSRIVQFSHFSVKEFLTSDRLATSTPSGNISRYHIILEPAHAILVRACMSVLLRSDDHVEDSGTRNSSPLAKYAAEYWIMHAQDEKKSSSLRRAMEYLFDKDKPYFAAWLQLHDIDTPAQSGSTFFLFSPISRIDATPLYYASLCGFQDLVEYLIVDGPKQVNARGGHYATPLVAALARGHFQTANLLHGRGAQSDVRGYNEMTPLHSAAYYGDFGMVQELLKYEADVKARNVEDKTPLHFASQGYYPGAAGRDISLSLSNIARLLLEHGADINARQEDHSTPLHFAAQNGRIDVVRVLLEHVTNLGAEDGDRQTALPVVLEYVDAQNAEGKTPLHVASQGPGHGDGDPNIALSLPVIARLLLEHGADVNARRNDNSTPLHAAAQNGRVEVVHVLLEHGADVGAEDGDGRTALQVAASKGYNKIMNLLLKHGTM